jgi:phosphotriesterase-related protein
VELDGLGPRQVERHAELVSALHARGLLGRVLVSHDAGWYHVGEPGGGTFRGYDTLVTEFLGALRRRGLGSGELRKLIVENPAAAFAIRARRA